MWGLSQHKALGHLAEVVASLNPRTNSNKGLHKTTHFLLGSVFFHTWCLIQLLLLIKLWSLVKFLLLIKLLSLIKFLPLINLAIVFLIVLIVDILKFALFALAPLEDICKMGRTELVLVDGVGSGHSLS